MELLFRLNVLNMDENTNAYFRNTGDETQKLSPSPEKWNDIYEFTSGNGTDWRYSKHWEYDGNAPYFAKYWQYNGGQYNDQVPVIRKSEMYYIAAEALVSKDSIAQAVAYLNEVSASDNVYVLPMPDNEIEFGNRQ